MERGIGLPIATTVETTELPASQNARQDSPRTRREGRFIVQPFRVDSHRDQQSGTAESGPIPTTSSSCGARFADENSQDEGGEVGVLQATRALTADTFVSFGTGGRRGR